MSLGLWERREPLRKGLTEAGSEAAGSTQGAPEVRPPG